MTSTPSQSEIFSQAVIVTCYLCSYVCIFLPGPAHSPKVKYSLTAVILVCLYGISFQTSTPSQNEILSQSCYCFLFVWSFLSGPAHPVKVKYTLKSVIVACSLCSYTVAFQDQYTLPKRNILFQSCYCGLLSLLKYVALSGPGHPPREKYFLKLLLWLAVSAHIQWPFRTTTPSQREIFCDSHYCDLFLWSFLLHPPKEKYSLTAVIVACSYGVSCQDQHTLPKWKVFYQNCYCGLFTLLIYTVVFRLIKLYQILCKLIPKFNFKMSPIFFHNIKEAFVK